LRWQRHCRGQHSDTGHGRSHGHPRSDVNTAASDTDRPTHSDRSTCDQHAAPTHEHPTTTNCDHTADVADTASAHEYTQAADRNNAADVANTATTDKYTRADQYPAPTDGNAPTADRHTVSFADTAAADQHPTTSDCNAPAADGDDAPNQYSRPDADACAQRNHCAERNANSIITDTATADSDTFTGFDTRGHTGDLDNHRRTAHIDTQLQQRR
jgi:hypothetical protein